MKIHPAGSRLELLGIALFVLGAGSAGATSCGSISNPTTCSVTVGAGSSTTYAFTNFTFLNTAQAGGGALYQAGDVLIDVATGGGTTGLLSFTKNAAGPTPGVVFLANPGDASGFSFSYDMTVTANLPGTVTVFSTTASLSQSNLGNGLSSVQEIIAPINCNVNTAILTKTCAITPTTTASVGNIVNVTGNTGNTSILSFHNLFDATFTPATSGVPEPATYGMIGAGLLAVFLTRRKAA